MKKILLWVAAPVVAVALAGCTPQVGTSAYPCESCNYGYVQVKKTPERKVWCIVEGKTVDCQKNPEGCPGCKKGHGK